MDHKQKHNHNHDQQQPQGMNIDMSKAVDLECADCKSKTFIPVFVLKKIPALLSPNGKDTFVPTNIFQCSKCHLVPDEFLSAFN